MARRPRLQHRGAIYHVMSRGNRKGCIFDDDDDRTRFLSIFALSCERYGVRCLAFCLMSNHYHAVLETPRGNLSLAMRYVNGVYTQYSNRRHGRTGHLFEGRFTSLVVENDLYLQTVVGYVVLNPVAAGIVGAAAEWPWSSHNATAGRAPAPAFLALDWIDWVFGGQTRRECQRKYRAFINGPIEIKDHGMTGPVLGHASFEAEVRAHIGATLYRFVVPRVYRSLAQPPLKDLFAGIGFRRAERDLMIQRAHVVYGYRLSEIAIFLRFHPNSMSKVLRRLRAGHRKLVE